MDIRYMRFDTDGGRFNYTLIMLYVGGNKFNILYLQIMDSIILEICSRYER